MARFVEDSAAIFSPSVARVAASTARDWSHVEAWLASKLPDQRLPSFERNLATLKALLALAAANEQADEEANLVLQLENSALLEIQQNVEGAASGDLTNTQDLSPQRTKDVLLSALEDELPSEAQTELGAVAALALELGIAHPEPEILGKMIMETQASIFEMEQMKNRVDVLQRHTEQAHSTNEASLQHLENPDLQRPEDLSKQNLDLQRRLRTANTHLSEPQSRGHPREASRNFNNPTIHDLAAQEQIYITLLSQKKELDSQLASFQGLPTDARQARSELEALRQQLRGVTSRRDQVFEGLVERESPVKRR